MSNKPVNFSAGRKAIIEYKKATQDLNGTLLLRVLYLKTGTQFTLDFRNSRQFPVNACSP